MVESVKRDPYTFYPAPPYVADKPYKGAAAAWHCGIISATTGDTIARACDLMPDRAREKATFLASVLNEALAAGRAHPAAATA